MFEKLLKIILVLGIVIGLWFAWTTDRERARLARHHERLRQVVGDFHVEDPSRPQIKALDTGEPLHFAWRMYVPADFRLSISEKTGSGGSSWSSSPSEFIARVRVRENDQGALDVYKKFSGGSSRSSLVPKPIADLLRGHEHEVIVEQIGRDSTAIDPGKPVVLLRLTLPESIQAEIKRTLPQFEQSQSIPTFYELTLDPQTIRP